MIEASPSVNARPARLLRWMNARSYGSSSQFKAAVEYLYAGTDVDFFQTALRLSALGHAEFDWVGADLRWIAVPASCYALSRGNARYLGVCGILTEDTRSALLAGGIGIELDTEYFLEGETMPRTLVRDNLRARKILRECGVAVSSTVYNDLRLRLPSISSLLNAGELIELPTAAGRYNASSGRFEEEAPLEMPFGPGCYRVSSFPRATYFWLTATDMHVPLCRVVDRAVGMWGAYIGGPVLSFTLRGGRLTVPAFPSLPVLYERMLYLGGARCTSRTKSLITFDHVEGDLVGALVQKLPLREKK